MKILVTGCAGLVGSNLCRALIETGMHVYGIDDLRFGSRENIPEGLAWIEKDFNEAGSGLLNQYDVLVHCATSNIIFSQNNETATFRNNALHTIGLFSRFNGKIIYTSTASVYNSAEVIPTPEYAKIHCVNNYDTSKRIAELYLQERGCYTTLRLSNVYGINQRPDNPYCGVIGKMVHSTLTDGTINIIGDGSQTRDFTFSDDVTDALIRAIELPPLNMEINVATEQQTSILELVHMIFSAVDKPQLVRCIDKRSIDTIDRRCLDITLANRVLNWKPKTEIKLGILKTINWQKTL